MRPPSSSRPSFVRGVAGLAVLAILLSACGPSGTPDLRVGDTQAAVPVSGSSQIVVSVRNDGDGDDELVGATTEVALGVELHVTRIEDDRATMEALDSVEIPAGETTHFRPGGLHLMMVVPDESVAEGGTFDLTLQFDRSDDITVPVEVVSLLDLAEDSFDDG